jgi:cell wall-associated NlpC family hydrolase
MTARINGFSVAYTAIGGLVMYSGVRGATLSDTFRSLLSGQVPSQNTQKIGSPQLGIANGGSGSAATGAGSSSDIVSDAQKYVNTPYIWGGAVSPTKGSPPLSDCSGFVNAVVGRDMGLPIPGYGAGQFNGGQHGPTTLSYLAWNGVTSVPKANMQAGDLVVWQTHMGIYIGNGNMISALDTNDGVKVTSLADGSPTGEVLFPKRLVNA